MITTEKLTIFDGEFTPETARSEVMQLLMERIRYHGLQSFSNEIRYGTDAEDHQHKLQNLKLLADKINSIAADASAQKKVKVVATIELQM